MVTLEWDLDRTDGVTLVSVYVGVTRPCRIRVENRLDGPVWPPRRQGRPAAGWDAAGFEHVVLAGDRLVCGYATPARPAEPPVALADAAPLAAVPNSSGRATGHPSAATVRRTGYRPADVVRQLGSPLPPRDAVPFPDHDDTPSARGSAPVERRTARAKTGHANTAGETAQFGRGSDPGDAQFSVGDREQRGAGARSSGQNDAMDARIHGKSEHVDVRDRGQGDAMDVRACGKSEDVDARTCGQSDAVVTGNPERDTSASVDDMTKAAGSHPFVRQTSRRSRTR